MPRHGPGLGTGNFPAANKLLMRYEADRAYKLHLAKINSVKHRLDVKEPKKQNHLILRLKQIQKEEERQAEIDHENKLLLSKMTQVMKYGGNIDNWNNYESRSLNYPFRERQNEEIARGNIGIARRLETVKPKVTLDVWEKDFRQHAYLKRMWNDSVKDFGEFTPRRYQSRMSRTVQRSLGDSMEDLYDEDLESVDTSEEKRFPKLNKSKKYRATKSDSNGPVTPRKQQAPPPAKSTKLPKITSKASGDIHLIEHDYSMYYSDVSYTLFKPPTSERSRTTRGSQEDIRKKSTDEKHNEDGVDTSIDKSPYIVKDKDNSDKRNKYDRKRSEEENSKRNKKNSKDDDLNAKERDNDIETRSFQSVNIAGNDLERVSTLISEEKDKGASKADGEEKDNIIDIDKDGDNDVHKKLDSSKESKSNEKPDKASDSEVLDKTDSTKDHHNSGNGSGENIRETEAAEHGGNSVPDTEDHSGESNKEDGKVNEDVDRKSAEDPRDADNDSTQIRDKKKLDEGEKGETEKGTGAIKSQAAVKADKGKVKVEAESKQHAGVKDDKLQKKKKEDGVTNTKDTVKPQDDKSDVAQLFKIAKKLGKPEDIFIKTLIKKTHKQRMVTKAKFRQKYDLDLISELKDGLGKPWEYLIETLLQERGMSDSYAVFDALSADKDKNKKTADMSDVVELLCSRDNAGLAELKESYRKEFSISLEEDISDRTSPPIQTLLLILQKERSDETEAPDEDAARQDAIDLYESGEGRWDGESGKFLMLLNDRSIPHLRVMLSEFKSVSEGQDLLEIVKKECPKAYYLTLQTLVKCIGSPASFYAQALQKRKQPADPIAINILVTRSEIDMPTVKKAYKALFRVDLIEEIKGKPHPTQKCLVELANKIPPGPRKGPDAKKTYMKQGTAELQTHPNPKPPQGAVKKHGPKKSMDATSITGELTLREHYDSSLNLKSSRLDIKTERSQKTQQTKSKTDNKDAESASKTKKTKSKEATVVKNNGTVKAASNFRPDDDCDKLNSAMSGESTDEHVINAIIPRRSNKQRQQLKTTYDQKFKKNLVIELTSELSGDMEEIVLALMMTPYEYDAWVLHEAVEGLGSSEATLIGILSTRSPGQMKAIREHYRKTYKTDMELDITRDSTGDFQTLLIELCKGQRDTNTAVNMAEAQTDAKELYNNGGALDPSSDTFKNLLAKKNHFQVKATFEEYKKLSGNDIYHGMAQMEEDGFISVVKAVEDPVQFYTEKLHDCFQGMRTNDNLLVRIVVPRSEIDLVDIKERYDELYQQSLYDVVNRECSGDYKTMLLAIIDNQEGGKKKDKKKEGGAKQKGEKTLPLTTGANDGTVKPIKPFNPVDDSERLHDCMSGLGTDEEVIVDILPQRTNDQRQEIKAKYQDKYTKSLPEDLESELGGDFKELVLALLMKPVDFDAHCLHEAITGLGTNEAVLIGILSTRTGKELSVIKDKYKEAYGQDLQTAISQDVSGDLEEMFTEILKCERVQGQDVNEQEARHDAKRLYKDGQISIDPKDETFRRIMAMKSRSQVRATFEEYKKLTGNDVYKGIEKAFMGDSEQAYMGLAKAVEDPVLFYTEKLHDGFEGMGTNDKQLIRIVVSRSEVDLSKIKECYFKTYQQKLYDVVNRECNGEYNKMLLAIIENKQGAKKKQTTTKTSTKKQQPQKGGKTSNSSSIGGTVKPWQAFNSREDSVRLHDAMSGFGTDESIVIDILPRRTNSQRQEIKTDYQEKYEKNLQEELESELRGDFEEIVLALLMTPVDYDAHCLHEAVAGLGTDEGILIGILSTRTGKELAAVKHRYKEVYGKELETAISEDVSGDLEEMLTEILKCERVQGQDVNLQEAKEDAQKLYKDGQISIDPKDETFRCILAKKSRCQVRATFEEYKKLTGNDIYQGIEKAFVGDSERAYKGLAKAVEDPVQFYTEKLHDSFDGLGTNDKQLTRIVISRSEIDLGDIEMRYKTEYKKTLSSSVQAECSGDYKKILLALLAES